MTIEEIYRGTPTFNNDARKVITKLDLTAYKYLYASQMGFIPASVIRSKGANWSVPQLTYRDSAWDIKTFDFNIATNGEFSCYYKNNRFANSIFTPVIYGLS